MTSLGLFENDVELYDPASVSIKGESAPNLTTYRFIPRDGSPNRLLERWEPQYALERVTKEHEMIANWIRAQEWGEHVPQSCWKYITTSKRIKSCRNQLRALVRELEADDD